MPKLVNTFPLIDNSTIYESPDGGKTVFERQIGEKPKFEYRGPNSDFAKALEAQSEWARIFHAAKDIPALQSAVEQCIILYRLSKKV